MAEEPARGVSTGTRVVLLLVAIGIVGVAGVQLWLRRPGGKEVRYAAAAYRQLVEVGGVLQRYWRNNHAFPSKLDRLVLETDPVTRAPYLPAEMLVNPWDASLEMDPPTPDRAVVHTRGPKVHLVLTVEKGENAVVEEVR